MSNIQLFIKNLLLVALIIGGIAFLGHLQSRKEFKELNNMTLNNAENQNITVFNLMANNKKMITSKDFKGGKINNMMASTFIDCTKADIPNKARFDINSIMGSVTLLVPEDWTVKTDLTSIMGNVFDHHKKEILLDSNKILYLDGLVLMGGLEVKRLK